MSFYINWNSILKLKFVNFRNYYENIVIFKIWRKLYWYWPTMTQKVNLGGVIFYSSWCSKLQCHCCCHWSYRTQTPYPRLGRWGLLVDSMDHEQLSASCYMSEHSNQDIAQPYRVLPSIQSAAGATSITFNTRSPNHRSCILQLETV